MTDISNAERTLRQALVALWRIRMAAETWGPDESPTVFANRIVYLAEAGMVGRRREAQQAAAEARDV